MTKFIWTLRVPEGDPQNRDDFGAWAQRVDVTVCQQGPKAALRLWYGRSRMSELSGRVSRVWRLWPFRSDLPK